MPTEILYRLLLMLMPSLVFAQTRPKNVIIMIPDGFGPASVTMARDFKHQTTGKRGLALDQFLTGTARTYSTDSRVTDSAAGATAYACGVKTYNGAIAVTPDKKPCATVFEGALRKGIWTGVVVTTRITHATPAAFSSHVPLRADEDDIAAQQIESGMRVIFGGGGKHFLPKEAGGNRSDGRNLLQEAQGKGYRVVQNLSSFRQLAGTQPTLAVFAPDHMTYEVDRNPEQQPSLAEMTKKALQMMKAAPKGFVLMVEGSRIDHAAHANDPVGHVHDILAYDEAVQVALDFARANGNTLVISVADHETGGMTLGRDDQYQWKPEQLAKATRSLDSLVAYISKPNADIRGIFKQYAGVEDVTDAEIAQLNGLMTDSRKLSFAIAHVVSKRSLIGWATGAHTAVDVNLYAYGPGSTRLRGNHENIDVGRTIAWALGIDLDALTRTLFR